MRCVYAQNQKVVWDSTGEITEFKIEHNKPCKDKFQGYLNEIPEFVDELFSMDISDFEDEIKGESEDELNEAQQQQLRDLGYL